jgi:serine/threonine-protein kinase HipA
MEKIFNDILTKMLSQSEAVEKMTLSSFLSESTKRNYIQSYQGRLKQLIKE